MSDPVWDLFRRGQIDMERHHRLVKEAVQKRLADLVGHHDITQGGRVVIPVRELREFRFQFDPEESEQTGTIHRHPQEPLMARERPRKGDILGYRRRYKGGSGQGSGDAGDTHEEGVYEVEIGVEEVEAALFAGLELPNLRRRAPGDVTTTDYLIKDIRRRGAMSNLDKRRTALENIRRNAAAGQPHFGGLVDEDLRFRTPEMVRLPQHRVAAVFIRDRSGSMDDEKKRLTRVLAFWIRRFLQYKYGQAAETAFVLFDSEAAEVGEEDFFHRSEGGGTRVSTGLALAQRIIRSRFPAEIYNLYVFLFSDGDNYSNEDDNLSRRIAEQLLADCNLMGYAEIAPAGAQQPLHLQQAALKAGGERWSSLGHVLRAIESPVFSAVRVCGQDDVTTALRTWFSRSAQKEAI